MRHAKFACSDLACFRHRFDRCIAASGAFHNPHGDMPSRLMFLSDGDSNASTLKGDFHLFESTGIKVLRDHVAFFAKPCLLSNASRTASIDPNWSITARRPASRSTWWL